MPCPSYCKYNCNRCCFRTTRPVHMPAPAGWTPCRGCPQTCRPWRATSPAGRATCRARRAAGRTRSASPPPVLREGRWQAGERGGQAGARGAPALVRLQGGLGWEAAGGAPQGRCHAALLWHASEQRPLDPACARLQDAMGGDAAQRADGKHLAVQMRAPKAKRACRMPFVGKSNSVVCCARLM